MIEWYQDSKYWEAVPVFVLQGFSAYEAEPMEHYLVDLLRDIFGNPFHPVGILPEWCTDTVQTLALSDVCGAGLLCDADPSRRTARRRL